MSDIHSDFWLGDSYSERLESADIHKSPVELAMYKRSISNFVRILTKKNIPVHFKVNGDSFTDGSFVCISSKINKKHFDSIVGLALHEGSHILLTDFSILDKLQKRIEDTNKCCKVNLTKSDVYNIKTLLNYVEDRRIDMYVFKNSPGYSGYYTALYDRYFNDKLIDKALSSSTYREITWDSYMFRIINLTNKNRDLSALPKLDEIYNVIFKSVSQLKNTTDALETAIEVYNIIESVVDSRNSDDGSEYGSTTDGQGTDGQSTDGQSTDGQSTDGQGTDGQGTDGQGTDGQVIAVSVSNLDESESNSKSDTMTYDSRDTSLKSKSNKKELTDSQLERLEKSIQKQKKFLDGDIQKSAISKSLSNEIENISKLSIDIVDVTYNTDDREANTNVVVLRGLNEDVFKFVYGAEYDLTGVNNVLKSSHRSVYSNCIFEGIAKGKILGKKLMVRNDVTYTDLLHRDSGKINRRQLYSLGIGMYDIFKKVQKESYKNAFIHLSVDISSSMNGTCYEKTLTCLVAIVKMSQIANIDIMVSARLGRVGGGSMNAITWILYDSRVDKLSTFIKYLRYVRPIGTTPEGLCFAAIRDTLPVGVETYNTYFINISDGMPQFGRYSGTYAIKHTKNEVDKLRKKGYNILSFYVSYDDYIQSKTMKDFKEMYGKSAKFIDINNLNKLTKKLQKTFEIK